MRMRQLHIFLAASLLLVGTGTLAQTFDGKKAYEIRTADGLVLDNRSSVQTESGLVLSQPEAGNAGPSSGN